MTPKATTKPVTPYQWVIGILISCILGMVGYIAMTKDKTLEAETILRQGRDESLQRQQSKTADKLEALTIEFEKYKASHP